MATLRLDVRFPSASSPIGLVAELRTVGSDGRSKVDRTFEVNANYEHLITDLPAGTWEVRVLAPAGPAVSGEVDLTVGGDERLVLNIAGPKAARMVRPTTSALNVPRRRGSATGVMRKNELALSDGYRGSVQASADSPDGLKVVTLQLGVDRPSDDFGAVQHWRLLARCVEGEVTPRAALAARPINTAGLATLVGRLNVRFTELPRSGRRVFATVEQAGRMRLHAVPTPFPSDILGEGICLSVDAEAWGSLRSSIVLADPRYAGIVAYLASGAVVAASQLVGDGVDALALNALRSKRASPLGASAAAYVLIGSQNLASDEPWQSWVANLREWFPEVPDGALLDARLQLLTAKTEAQKNAVLPLLKEAVARGLPFYAVGVGWLLQSIRHFPHDRLLSDALPYIERIAAALDMDEPFTTLWIGDNR
ncbi:hypothetical protein C8J35_1304 [Rhizobium sp. PP-F2F-G38]|nr:hypothetical protein C8J35_1304 [Rhizobium sp. PP-F2F-G38]